MANRQGGGVRVADYAPEAAGRSGVAGLPMVENHVAGTAGAMWSRLSDRFGQIADRAAQIEGARAGKIAGNDPNFRPSGSATLRGYAADQAGIGVYTSNLTAQLGADMAQAFEQNRDNPGGFAAASNAIRANYLKSHVFPEIQGDFNERWMQLNTGYVKTVGDAAVTKQRDQQRASYITDMQRSEQQLSQMAVGGADPEMVRRQAALLNADDDSRLDGMVASGAITAEQAAKSKAGNRSARAVQIATVEAGRLQSPEAVEAAGRKLREDYAAGRLPDLSPDDYVKLEAGVQRLAASMRTTQNAQLKELNTDIDDMIGRVGKGYQPTQAEQAILEMRATKAGPEGVAAWNQARAKMTIAAEVAGVPLAQSEARYQSELAASRNPIGAGPVTGASGYGLINAPYRRSVDAPGEGGKLSPRAHYDYLKSIGASDKEALLLTGAAASESSFNPDAVHDNHSGSGLYGHNHGRLDMRGKGWQDQASAALQEFRSRPESRQLEAAKSAADLAEIQMHYERPRGYSPKNPRGGDNYTGRANTIAYFSQAFGSGGGDQTGSAVPASTPAGGAATRGDDGYWRMPNVEYDLAGKIRSRPVARPAVEAMSAVVSDIDPSLTIRFVSGGQDAEGPNRTGSDRHDVDETGEAHTGDLVLVRNGKPIMPGEDKALYARVMQGMAVKGFTGIGHYGWGIHVGTGDKAAWGPSKTSRDLDPHFGAAIEAGWAGAPAGASVGATAGGPAGFTKNDADLAEFRRLQIEKKRSAIASDPLGTAATELGVTVPPIDVSSQTLALDIGRRVAQAEAVGRYYERPPVYLRDDEKQALLAQVKADPLAATRTVADIVRGAGTSAPAILAEIGDGAPELAQAAVVSLNTGNDSFARTVAEGLKARKEAGATHLPSPKQEDVRTVVDGELAGALAGFSGVERQRTLAAVDVWYQQEAQRRGISPDDAAKSQKLYSEGLQLARGRTTVNGIAYGGLAPTADRSTYWGQASGAVQVPGDVRADAFDGLLQALSDEDLATLPEKARPVGPDGQPMQAADMMRSLPIMIPGGDYAFGVTDPLTGKRNFVMAGDGKVFRLPWDQMAPRLRQRMPEAFR